MIDIKEITPLIEAEQKRMAEEYGDSYHSLHEAYAVIKEEIEEAEAGLDKVEEHLDIIWAYIKLDDEAYVKTHLERLEYAAMYGIAELIQVAACCRKALGEK